MWQFARPGEIIFFSSDSSGSNLSFLFFFNPCALVINKQTEKHILQNLPLATRTAEPEGNKDKVRK